MKRLVLITGTVLLAVCFIYPGFSQHSDNSLMNPDVNVRLDNERPYNPAPDFVFDVPPLYIAASLYDYFPGGFTSLPLSLQPSPAGNWDGGGVYLFFLGLPSAGAARRIVPCYILNGTLLGSTTTFSFAESSPSSAMDMNTGNPFICWQSMNEGCLLTFDQYDLIGAHGLWANPITVLDDAVNPSVWISASPLPGQSRIYVTGNVYQEIAQVSYLENVILAYTDFSHPLDLVDYEPDAWTLIEVPYFSDWSDFGIQAFFTPVVAPDLGHVAYIGHTVKYDSDDPFDPHNFLFVIENDNYGEGEWQLYTGDPTIPVTNPDDYFTDPDNQPYEDMRYRLYANRHTAAVDDQGNYHFSGFYALYTEDYSYFPYFSTAKHIMFDRDEEEFIIKDLYPRHEVPGSLYLPWSIPPEYDNEDNLIVNYSWPCYWHDPEDLFFENYFRMVSYEDKLITLFQSNSPDEGLQTRIMVSNDYGQNWTDPIILSAAETPELSNMIPTYWYMANRMEHLYANWYRLHLMFYDQNHPGSHWIGNGPNTGGTIIYTSLDIDFSTVSVSEEIQATKPSVFLKHNHPNPFNPETTISFFLPENMRVSVEVFNIKGQLIKTLLNDYRSAGDNYVVWNGKDNDNREAGSGVYFYRLTTPESSEVRKMLLLK